jgi:hypothetical protein
MAVALNVVAESFRADITAVIIAIECSTRLLRAKLVDVLGLSMFGRIDENYETIGTLRVEF